MTESDKRTQMQGYRPIALAVASLGLLLLGYGLDSVPLLLIGLVIFIGGCTVYAWLKGLPPLVGLLLTPLGDLGLGLLFFLPDRRVAGTEASVDERQAILDALAKCGGLIYGPHGAAAALGLKPTVLHGIMRKHHIEWGQLAGADGTEAPAVAERKERQ